MSPELQSTLQKILVFLVFAFGAIVFALILSFVSPPIIRALRELIADIERGQRRVLEAAEAYFRPLWTKFWIERASEPAVPAAAQLERIADEMPNMGTNQVRELQLLQLDVDRTVQSLNDLAVPTNDSQKTTARTTAVQSGSLLEVLGGLLIALAVGGVNSFLLNVFFKETLGSFRLLPYPLPNIQASHVIAVLFFVVEIAIGWYLYRTEKRRTSGGTTKVHWVPWMMLIGLLVVEVAAYSVLSVRVNLPRRLSLTPNSAFYGITLYFLAIFGACITAMLAFLGHSVAESIDNYKATRAENRAAKLLHQEKKSQVSDQSRLERIEFALEKMKTAAAGMPRDLSSTFQRTVGDISGDQSFADALRQKVLSLVSTDVHGTALQVRSRSNVVADLAIGVGLLVGLIAVAAIVHYSVVEFLRVEQPSLAPILASVMAIVIIAAVVTSGLAFRGILPTRKRSSIPGTVIFHRPARVGLALVAAGLLLTGAIVLAYIFGAVGIFGSSVLLNCAAGILIAVFGGICGVFLDWGFLAGAHLATLSWLALVKIGGWLLAAAMLSVAGVAWLITYLVRLLAIPGDVVRSLFQRKSSEKMVVA